MQNFAIKRLSGKQLSGERLEMDYPPIVEELSQLLVNDWDNRSTMVNLLQPLALEAARHSARE